jgi:hypothetical protein
MQRLAIGGAVIIGIAAFSRHSNAPHALWRSQGKPQRALDLTHARVWLVRQSV